MQPRGHIRRCATAYGASIVWCAISVGHDQPDRIQREAEFFGDSLGERCSDILTNLDFAGVDDDRSILLNVQPVADSRRVLFPARRVS